MDGPDYGGVRFRVAVGNLPGAVGGAVVDDDDFHPLTADEQAVDALFHIVLGVVAGYGDGQEFHDVFLYLSTISACPGRAGRKKQCCITVPSGPSAFLLAGGTEGSIILYYIFFDMSSVETGKGGHTSSFCRRARLRCRKKPAASLPTPLQRPKAWPLTMSRMPSHISWDTMPPAILPMARMGIL